MVGLVQGMQLMLENHRAACSVGGFPCSQFLLFPSSHSAPHFLLHQGNWLPSSCKQQFGEVRMQAPYRK